MIKEPVNVVNTILRVLAGIRTAATSGDICAVTEKYIPNTLYITEMINVSVINFLLCFAARMY